MRYNVIEMIALNLTFAMEMKINELEIGLLTISTENKQKKTNKSFECAT